MISIEALNASGLSNRRLKEIFTATAPAGAIKKTKVKRADSATETDSETAATMSTLVTLNKLPKNPTDWEIRCYLTTQIRGEVLEGQMRCAQNFDKHGAMALAYSSMPIHPLVPDLMKVAMGYVKLKDLEKNIAGLSEETKKHLFQRDARGEATAVNEPELIRVSHNLVHSLVTRRVAALATEVYQQFPVLEYVPFSNNQTGRLIGDVMTQLTEQMAGAFGYRHDYEESIRQSSLVTSSVHFKEKAWTVEKQTVPVFPPTDGAKKAGRQAKPTYERKIVREGVKFITPDQSRVSYDISQPLSKLNHDCGPRWINHWEVVPIGDIRDDPAYFNKEAIAMDTEMFSLFTNNAAYFSQFYDRISFPAANNGSAATMSQTNDRVAQIGAWAQLPSEISTVLTQHYKKVIPKSVGLGTYQDPVWIRFVMAANTTVVYAEITGSAPASVNSYNASDGLLLSPSFGWQAIQWQQMLTNQLNMLVHAQYQEMVEIWALNKDGMTKADIERIVNQLKNPDFTHLANAVITYSQEKLSQIGQQAPKGADRLSRIVVDSSAKINSIFTSMIQTLAMAERLMFFSPQELGQVSPRTVSATEMKAVRDTTLGIRDFHLIGIKQQMDADKRIIHDSYMAFGSEELEVPVAERYEPAVIVAAGFEIVDDGTGLPPDGLYTIKGKKLGLFYNYTYTTRNTDDTPPDATVAQGIAQIYEIIAKDPVISENTTLDQRLEFVNSLMQILAPTIFKLRVPPGTDGKKTTGGAVEQMQAQLKQMLPQIGQALQQLQKTQADQAAKIQQTDAGLTALAQALDRLTKALAPAAPALGAAPIGPAPAGPPGQNAPGVAIPGTTPALRASIRARPVPLLG